MEDISHINSKSIIEGKNNSESKNLLKEKLYEFYNTFKNIIDPIYYSTIARHQFWDQSCIWQWSRRAPQIKLCLISMNNRNFIVSELMHTMNVKLQFQNIGIIFQKIVIHFDHLNILIFQ